MKIEFKNKRLIKYLLIISSVLTMIFASLSMLYIHSWIIRVATQFSLSLTMVFCGIETYFVKKKKIAIFLWAVAVFLMFIMIETIITSVQYI